MKKLLLTLLIAFSSLFASSQYVSDKYTLYPDIYRDSFTVHHGEFTLDFVQRGDSMILIIEKHGKDNMKSELYLEQTISQKYDVKGDFWITFAAINVKLLLPEIVVIVKNGKEILSVGISDGQAMAQWVLKRKDANIL